MFYDIRSVLLHTIQSSRQVDGINRITPGAGEGVQHTVISILGVLSTRLCFYLLQLPAGLGNNFGALPVALLKKLLVQQIVGNQHDRNREAYEQYNQKNSS